MGEKGEKMKNVQELLKYSNILIQDDGHGERKQTKGLHTHFTNEYTRVANKFMKKCSTSSAIRTMQIKLQ